MVLILQPRADEIACKLCRAAVVRFLSNSNDSCVESGLSILSTSCCNCWKYVSQHPESPVSCSISYYHTQKKQSGALLPLCFSWRLRKLPVCFFDRFLQFDQKIRNVKFQDQIASRNTAPKLYAYAFIYFTKMHIYFSCMKYFSD